MATREFSKDDFCELFEGGELVEKGSWRWGHTETRVFEHDGKFWMGTIDVHSQDGWQIIGNTVTVDEVHQVKRIVKSWEAVP